MPSVGGHSLPLFLSEKQNQNWLKIKIKIQIKIDLQQTLHCLLQTQSGFFIGFQISPILAGLMESPHYIYLCLKIGLLELYSKASFFESCTQRKTCSVHNVHNVHIAFCVKPVWSANSLNTIFISSHTLWFNLFEGGSRCSSCIVKWEISNNKKTCKFFK